MVILNSDQLSLLLFKSHRWSAEEKSWRPPESWHWASPRNKWLPAGSCTPLVEYKFTHPSTLPSSTPMTFPHPQPHPPSYTKACTIIITRILCSSPRSHLIKLCNKVLTYDHSQNHRARICHIWFRTTIHMTYILKACWTIRDFRNQETSIWLHFEISRSLISSRF